jgi:hypothetical protein
MQLESAVESLIGEVEALCAKHVGEHAEGEYWLQTSERIRRLDRLVKHIRMQQNSGANHKILGFEPELTLFQVASFASDLLHPRVHRS